MKVDQIARGVARARQPATARGQLRPGRSNGHSWLRDLVGRSADATLRLQVNNDQARDEGVLERAGFSQTAGAGGEFVPPTYLLDRFAPICGNVRKLAYA